MAQVLHELFGGKRKAQVLVHISIKKVKTNQKPTSRTASRKKGSGVQKIMYSKRRKTDEEPSKRHRARYRKARRSGPLRGVRRRQRTRQRRRVHFASRKRALPAFFLFMADHRTELQRSNPHWTVIDTAKELGRMWHEQPESDKTRYKREAARLRRQRRKRRA